MSSHIRRQFAAYFSRQGRNTMTSIKQAALMLVGTAFLAGIFVSQGAAQWRTDSRWQRIESMRYGGDRRMNRENRKRWQRYQKQMQRDRRRSRNWDRYRGNSYGRYRTYPGYRRAYRRPAYRYQAYRPNYRYRRTTPRYYVVH